MDINDCFCAFYIYRSFNHHIELRSNSTGIYASAGLRCQLVCIAYPDAGAAPHIPSIRCGHYYEDANAYGFNSCTGASTDGHAHGIRLYRKLRCHRYQHE